MQTRPSPFILSNTMQLTPVTIPESLSDFAKAVALLADAHDIKRFQLTFRPTFEQLDRAKGQWSIEGDMQISYTSIDSRGRPCKHLSLQVRINDIVPIISEPSSL